MKIIKKPSQSLSGFPTQSSFSVQTSHDLAPNSQNLQYSQKQHSGRNSPNQSVQSRSNSPHRNTRYCKNCKKTNHWTNKCWFRKKENTANSNNNHSNYSPISLLCTLHGYGNHTSDYCRTLTKPYYCDNHGQGNHSTSYCYNNSSRPNSRNSQP